jgi:hypothetical protein
MAKITFTFDDYARKISLESKSTFKLTIHDENGDVLKVYEIIGNDTVYIEGKEVHLLNIE